jgi:hypothetical protein
LTFTPLIIDAIIAIDVIIDTPATLRHYAITPLR